MLQPIVSSGNPPTLQDLIGCPIKYVYGRPYKQKPIVTTGVVREIRQRDNILYMLVEPHDKRSRPGSDAGEFDFIHYMRGR